MVSSENTQMSDITQIEQAIFRNIRVYMYIFI